eukprot:COSAG01_NODE_68399_length_264_cov_0.630303_1_plen_53_part_10
MLLRLMAAGLVFIHLLAADGAAPPHRRRVSWFNSGGGWTVGADGLDFRGWLAS